jgi:hypothetical protein
MDCQVGEGFGGFGGDKAKAKAPDNTGTFVSLSRGRLGLRPGAGDGARNGKTERADVGINTELGQILHIGEAAEARIERAKTKCEARQLRVERGWRAANGDFGEGRGQTAQFSVMPLWMGCTRLKTQEIESGEFD